jgi:hypothetical protein
MSIFPLFNRIFIVYAAAIVPLQAMVYYVDQKSAGASDQNSGTLAQPWKTITKANQALLPGDTVLISAGTFNATIAPVNSGTVLKPIVYANFSNDSVVISETVYGVNLNAKSYITIQGIHFYKLDLFLYIQEGSNFNTIAYCTFDQGRKVGWSGSKIYRNSSYNRVHHCRFSKYGYYTDDDIGCILDIGNEESKTDFTTGNLFENNVLYHGGHHILGVYGMKNVIRNNYFHNEPWAMGTAASDRGAILYGDRNLSFSGYVENSGRNLFEGNRVAYSSDPPDNVGASGLALNTGYNIVRHNYFYHNDRAGLSLSVTSSYLSNIVNNRVYHNTFFHNGINTQDPVDHMNSGIGFGIYSGPLVIRDNTFKNNILYRHSIPIGEYNINTTDRKGLIAAQVFANNWDGDTRGDPKFINAGINLGDPMDQTLPDLRIQAESPCRDSGGALTTITSADASGRTFVVADAGYFMDGWEIAGVMGDEIQLYQTTQRARIAAINYTNNTISVDKDLTWTKGQGVCMAYAGLAPDIGANEIGLLAIKDRPKISRDRFTPGSAPLEQGNRIVFPATAEWQAYDIRGRRVRTGAGTLAVGASGIFIAGEKSGRTLPLLIVK